MTADAVRLTAALADRYRLERELGAGGMATVYLAKDLKHDRQVAVKVLRPELAAVIGAERFLSEIRTTANLQHPHILPLHDSGECEGFLFYVMPLVEGQSLRDRLTHEKQLPIADAVRITSEVAGALDYAHRHGVIHRDIKPENILLHDGRALVADFGIALAASKAGDRMTQTGMSLGTPSYMSPEQAMGEREITARSDVYALGCVLYEMLAGEPPFSGPTAQAIVARVMTEEPRSLLMQRKTIPPHVDAAVAVALAKLPADRFATAAQFAEALARPGTATVPMASVQRGPAPGRSRVGTWAPWAVAALGLGAAAWGWSSRPRAEGTRWQHLGLGQVALPREPQLASLAISPDGSIIAVASGAVPSQLHLKRGNQLQAMPLPGTEGAIYPTFSPDGKWIAFVSNGALRKVQVEGGAVVTLTDAAFDEFGGVAWLDDGTMVFAGPTTDQLSRIGADGGAVTTALRDPALAGRGLGSLIALPGARGVLFEVCSSGCVTLTLNVLDLQTGTQHQLLDGVTMAWYLPKGYLAYLQRDGTIMAAPFDLDKLALTGPGLPVVQGVATGLGLAQAALSRSGTLVYLEASGAATEVEVVRVSRSGIMTPVDTAWHGGFNSAALSPDGRRLALGVGLASGALDIWIKELDHGPFSRLSFGGDDRRPAWSPDGTLVAFIRDTADGSSVYVRRTDGSTTETRLAKLAVAIQEVTWSPDARWLVVRTDNGDAGAGDILAIPTSGDTTTVPLAASRFTELHPAVSPDGRWLAYTSNESGQNEVFVRPFAANESGRWQISTDRGEQPLWSRDGRELTYSSKDQFIAAAIRTTPSFEVTARQPLFNLGPLVIDPFHTSYETLPNGQGFMFMRPPSAGASAKQPSLVLVERWFTDLDARLKR
jgi:tRNA A-37 threonylcarbamoyl transferase component Bud32/WD40 repeat protein